MLDAEITVSDSDVVAGEAGSPVIQEVDILFLDSASEPLTTNQDAEGSQAKVKSGDGLLFELFFVPILTLEFVMNLHPCHRPYPLSTPHYYMYVKYSPHYYMYVE